MILYLSGPITGVPDYKEKFDEAAEQLRGRGYTVLNPASAPLGLTQADNMRISLTQLEAADAIALLDGWALSRGAVIEGLYAAYIGKMIFMAGKNPFTGQIGLVPVDRRWLEDVAATGITVRLRGKPVDESREQGTRGTDSSTPLRSAQNDRTGDGREPPLQNGGLGETESSATLGMTGTETEGTHAG